MAKEIRLGLVGFGQYKGKDSSIGGGRGAGLFINRPWNVPMESCRPRLATRPRPFWISRAKHIPMPSFLNVTMTCSPGPKLTP